MSRVKKGLTKSTRHKKVLASTKGYRGAKSKLYRTAKEASLHAGDYAFSGRKQNKRQKRSLWITKISNTLKADGKKYNLFISQLNKNNIQLDRKILADIAENHPKTFKKIVDKIF